MVKQQNVTIIQIILNSLRIIEHNLSSGGTTRSPELTRTRILFRGEHFHEMNLNNMCVYIHSLFKTEVTHNRKPFREERVRESGNAFTFICYSYWSRWLVLCFASAIQIHPYICLTLLLKIIWRHFMRKFVKCLEIGYLYCSKSMFTIRTPEKKTFHSKKH